MRSPLILNSHENDGNGSGNGHHGSCKHCGVPLVTDLGYCSWEGVKCVDRVKFLWYLEDFPEDIQSYANFNGMTFNKQQQKFVKPYDRSYTILEIEKIVNKLRN